MRQSDIDTILKLEGRELDIRVAEDIMEWRRWQAVNDPETVMMFSPEFSRVCERNPSWREVGKDTLMSIEQGELVPAYSLNAERARWIIPELHRRNLAVETREYPDNRAEVVIYSRDPDIGWWEEDWGVRVIGSNATALALCRCALIAMMIENNKTA